MSEPGLVLRGGFRTSILLIGLFDAAIAASGAAAWSRGAASTAYKVGTVVFALLLLHKIQLLRNPAQIRLHEDRLHFRLGWGMHCSTPRLNVAQLEVVDGHLCVRFEDLAKVDVGPALRGILEQNAARQGLHVRIPMRMAGEPLQVFRAAVFAGR